MEADTHKIRALARMRLRATLLLSLAALLFAVAAALPQSLWVRLVKAASEAAMVGGLADWFAVVALFRHPLGLPIPHTAIVPSNKDRIAASLAEFIQHKFLNQNTLVELIERSNPAALLGRWLAAPGNAELLGRQAMGLLRGWLNLVDDREIHALMADALRTAVSKVDPSRSLGSLLDLLTRDNRQQQLLDPLLGLVIDKLRDPALRQSIAERVADWLRTEHGWLQKVLPTEWVGERTAEFGAEIVERMLQQVVDSPEHELRHEFNSAVLGLVQRLKRDPEFIAKGLELRDAMLASPALADYTRQLWDRLRDWLAAELSATEIDEDSALQSRFEQMGRWLGRRLEDDAALRAAINALAQRLARHSAPGLADFVAEHIRKTVRNWDADELSRTVELNIGADLQSIRISGTLVGACIGLLLFVVSNPGEIGRALFGGG